MKLSDDVDNSAPANLGDVAIHRTSSAIAPLF
jgi:hypothetical protein